MFHVVVSLLGSSVRADGCQATYSLIVESCVNAGDLRAASDFLNKMEPRSTVHHEDVLYTRGGAER